jgi:hypothetical protein
MIKFLPCKDLHQTGGMMNVIKYVKILEGVGISREQAEAHLQIIQEITEGELATKQDLNTLESSLKQDIKTLESTFRQDFKILETNVLSANQVLEYRITIKLGTLFVIGFTAMATILKFWLVG